jgi:hypothetical protein
MATSAVAALAIRSERSETRRRTLKSASSNWCALRSRGAAVTVAREGNALDACSLGWMTRLIATRSCSPHQLLEHSTGSGCIRGFLRWWFDTAIG